MSTTIQSTELDFFEIKESLKSYFKQQDEFQDYDFEGSALSNLLDVLASNTHYNSLVTNFALNESYLTTAQLRNSVVGLAESLGYIPTSKASAQSTVDVRIVIEPERAAEMTLEPRYTILPGQLKLKGSVDDFPNFFTNRETLIAESVSLGIYQVSVVNEENSPIRVYEGEERTLDFLVDNTPDAVYVIPDEDIDTSSVIIKVFDNQGVSSVSEEIGEGSYKVYSNVFDASTIDEKSRLYVLRESPNRFYELSFGDNNSLGQTPSAGNVIRLNYLKSKGSNANGASNLSAVTHLDFDGYKIEATEIDVVTLTRAAGGGERESIESIRKRAPFQYASQNRMITPLDYEALILRKFSNFIDDIVCWGGEDDVRKDYGSVYVSIKWSKDLNSTAIGELREQIRELGKNFSVVSFQIKFLPSSETYISTDTYYQYNPTLSSKTESAVTKSVRDVMNNYFSVNTGEFGQVFRRSNMLTLIDESDPSILSSRSNITLHKRITPILTVSENYNLVFPVALKDAVDTEVPVIKSSIFTYQGKTMFIRNKLTDRVKVSPEGRVPIIFDRLPSTKLEVVDLEGNIQISNIGSYNPATGEVKIQALTIDSVLGNTNYIKLFATPANESAIESKFNNLLEYDNAESYVSAVSVNTRV